MDTRSSAHSSLIDLPEARQLAKSSTVSTEVSRAATRRRFTWAYKRKIVTLASNLPAGEIGALLRREGLYSSHLTNWRHLLAAHDAAITEPRRGRKPDPARPDRLRIEKLERENSRLLIRLQHAEAIMEAQKKLCALLGLPSVEEQP
jgi:transposase-like protein